MFAYFTLLLGAEFPSHLRPKILEATNWENEKYLWPEEDALMRKFYLNDLGIKVLNYKSGKPLHLVSLKNFVEDLKEGVVGLDQFWKYTLSGKLFKVRHINLDSCELNDIPKPILDHKNLETLSLEHNNLKELPDEIGNLVSLKRLFLDGNLLRRLPDSIGNMKSLEDILLNNNKIRSLPDAIGNLPKIDTILLNNNEINSLPESLLKAKTLKKIVLLNNQMKVIPHKFKESHVSVCVYLPHF